MQIKTKRYNVHGARLIGYGLHDHNLMKLYIKRTGECFFYDVDNKKINPITEDVAMNFCESNHLEEEFERAKTYINSDKSQVNVYLTDNSKGKLKELAQKKHMSVSECMDMIIAEAYQIDLRERIEREKALQDLIKKLAK